MLFDRNREPPTEDEIRDALVLALPPETVRALQEKFPGTDLDPMNVDLDILFKRFAGVGVAALTKNDAERISTPWRKGETNDVIRGMLVHRDRHALEVMDDVRRSGKRSFVLAGNDHVITWEPALEKMYGTSS